MADFGSRLIFGFSGCDPTEAEPRQIQAYLKEGLIGGVILFAYNIRDPQQLAALTQSFHEAAAPRKPLIAVDQEGGRVQRLSAKNGFHDVPSAKQMAASFTPLQAYEMYKEMAREVKAAGFNLNFGPVVDLEYEKPSGQPCPVIGTAARSYGPEAQTVVSYAQAFIKAHREHGILTCLKHYPGHGFAASDSHKEMVDITKTWRPAEEQPFRELAQNGDADMIMVAHLMNKNIDGDYPASLSPKILKNLRSYYDGVVVSDDLHMGAIAKNFGPEETLRQTLQAEVDLLVFSNNPKAMGGAPEFQRSLTLVDKMHRLAEDLGETGIIPASSLNASCLRLKNLKEKL